MTAERLDRAGARSRFGLPDAHEGSVNDPRSRESHGVRWNEKWIYFLPEGSRRVVLWHRYAYRGVFVEPAEAAAG